MTTDIKRARPNAVAIVAASLYSVVLTTGALMLVLAVAAAMKGGSVADLFAEVFPRMRGGVMATEIPGLGYALFVIYIVVASTIAIITRRRFAQRWSRPRG
jgi:hypothetical protein